MTEEILINAGYKDYEVPIVERYANRFLQKKIKDANGIKYYIDVYEYELSSHSDYEFRLVTRKDNFWAKTIIYGIDSMNLNEIEKEIENIWKNCKFSYYELYEEVKL